MTQIRRVWKQENEKNARKHYGIRSRGRHKSFYMRRNGKKLIPFAERKNRTNVKSKLADSEEEIRIAIERKKKKNETETWIEKLETEIVQLQEEKNQCDRKQAVFRQETWKTKSSSR